MRAFDLFRAFLADRPPSATADWLGSIVTLLVFTGLVWIVGRLLLERIGKSSPARRRHGKFVLGWMLAGWLIGGTAGVCLLDNRVNQSVSNFGAAGFGMLIGWVVGTIHGLLAFWIWPDKTGVAKSVDQSTA